MQKHRATVLMALLLALVGYYLFQERQVSALTAVRVGLQRDAPLEGKNEIRSVIVRRNDKGHHLVKVDYRYRGSPRMGRLRVYALRDADVPSPQPSSGMMPLAKGEHTLETRLWRDQSNYFAHSTRIVRVEMYSLMDRKVILSRDVEYPVDWPRLNIDPPAAVDQDKDIDTLYREAVAEIDYGSSAALQNARRKLEIIVARDPRFVPAYPEMARYYMKTNWGPEGRRQAERVLENGLAIDPNHANSHVLIGYVYAHQGRYKKAAAAFARAAEIGTPNLWLWDNWGELLLMQGRVPEAIAMYEKAIAGGRTYDTYDRARKDGYRHLIDIHRLAKEYARADELHRKRIAEYTTEACYPYRYAKFRQQYFDDADTVLEYARRALDTGCRQQVSVRRVIGVAYYSKWLDAETPDEARSYLSQAQLFFAEGPQLVYWLAQSDKTAPVIEGLIADGVSIDITDNDGLTALAYAVKKEDVEAMQRLIALGGNPAATIGKEKIPLLAIAVLSNSKESVKCLLDNGADIDTAVYGGVTLLELAEGMGYGEVAELLRNAGGKRI